MKEELKAEILQELAERQEGQSQQISNLDSQSESRITEDVIQLQTNL